MSGGLSMTHKTHDRKNRSIAFNNFTNLKMAPKQQISRLGFFKSQGHRL